MLGGAGDVGAVRVCARCVAGWLLAVVRRPRPPCVAFGGCCWLVAGAVPLLRLCVRVVGARTAPAAVCPAAPRVGLGRGRPRARSPGYGCGCGFGSVSKAPYGADPPCCCPVVTAVRVGSCRCWQWAGAGSTLRRRALVCLGGGRWGLVFGGVGPEPVELPGAGWSPEACPLLRGPVQRVGAVGVMRWRSAWPVPRGGSAGLWGPRAVAPSRCRCVRRACRRTAWCRGGCRRLRRGRCRSGPRWTRRG